MRKLLTRLMLLVLLPPLSAAALAQEKTLPPDLEPWRDWATWDLPAAYCPAAYNNASTRLTFWPSTLTLNATADRGDWRLEVTIFQETWVPLPGGLEEWPQEVTANDQPVVVVQRDGRPHVKLPVGEHALAGAFLWSTMPQKLALPSEIGLLQLSIAGQAVRLPNWDAGGNLWLRRTEEKQEAKDQLTRRVYRVLEDGAPLWLRTEVELKVSGKSREETLGVLLPEGWRLATIDSPLPVAIDDSGVIKAQVRAGQWTIAAHAFRVNDLSVLTYAEGQTPMAEQELIALRAAPNFRVAELEGAQPIDATQTTFPGKWRDLPVYQWDTEQPVNLVEKLRGMGEQADAGLSIRRELWLDQDGRNATYRDIVRGDALRVWRLDAAAGLELGSVRVSGESQLITKNPSDDTPGVEVRDSALRMEAVGRAPIGEQVHATGWQADAENLQMTLNLPPGWRVLALLGADRVRGDWLTAWTLLDLFLLLVFATAVLRIWGWQTGLIALLAFGLAYHERGAPRLTWLFLLAPLALLRVSGDGLAMRLLLIWKYIALLLLAVVLLPFLVSQVQSALYPQLEPRGYGYQSHWGFGVPGVQAARESARRPAAVLLGDVSAEPAAEAGPQDEYDYNSDKSSLSGLLSLESQMNRYAGSGRGRQQEWGQATGNMSQVATAVIQTGPATPTWSWNRVDCWWDGPVDATQQIQPLLITPTQNRLLTVARLGLLLLLAALLLGWRLPAASARGTAAAFLALCWLSPSDARADFPSPQMLNELRNRLNETSDAFPNAAEIPTASLKVDGDRITLTAEVHTAATVAVPLPGRLPAWSPVSVAIDGEQQAVLRREQGYLWVTLPAGVHKVMVEGLLPEVSDWEWTYLLKPRRVAIDAPDWTVTGVKPTGVPENQVFFVRKQQRAPGEAAYDQKHFAAVAIVDRQLEIGLVWKLHTTVTRLSEAGKAVSLSIPLVEGERLLSSSTNVEQGRMNVRLAAGQNQFTWESELSIRPQVALSAPQSDAWVESWRLMLSPVWNVGLEGLPPIFEASGAKLQPTWRPWPGEQATLSFSRPESVEGQTVTIHSAEHQVALGRRQRAATLSLDVECSLANDFVIKLPTGAEVTSLKLAGQSTPVRRDGDSLIVPAKPGRQQVLVEWKQATVLETTTTTGQLELPAESANVTTQVTPPGSRWVLWAQGPLRGPAVRFWTLLIVALIAALVLGALPNSPLPVWQWVLLALGLTQAPVLGAVLVVAWLMLLGWRGRLDPEAMSAGTFNAMQCALVMLTLIALLVLLVVVGEGLLGDPRMFISGNGSSRWNLQWFEPRSDATLPVATVVSVSVWWYRLLMLLWALWLASSLVGWLKRGWSQFTHGTAWRAAEMKAASQS